MSVADRYGSWAELAASEPPRAWRIVAGGDDPAVLHLAIHGGGIEQGTGEAARAAAEASGASFYVVEGLLASGSGRLHVTSDRFDEPGAVAAVARARRVVSWHGAEGDEAVTWLGGLDAGLRDGIGAALKAAGFLVASAEDVRPEIAGASASNIANRGGAGVQLELSRAQRAAFFPGGDLRQASRESGRRTPAFAAYIEAVNAGVAARS